MIPPSVGAAELSQLISVQTWMQTVATEIQAVLILPANKDEKLCGISNLGAAPSCPDRSPNFNA